MALTKIRGNTQIKSSTITNVEIAANAGIELSKLAEGAELIKRDGSVAFTGNVDLGSHKLTNVAAPTAAGDAANKSFVDAGDAAVQANVDAEVARALAAEGVLQANIEAEAAARAAADLVLQGHIDDEAAARAAADLVLQGHIDDEAAARAAADLVLQGHIDDEAARALAAEGVLDGRLDVAEADIVALEGRMDSAEADVVGLDTRVGTLENGLQAETSARIAADSALNGRVTVAEGDIVALEGRMDSAEGRLDVLETDLAAEVARAIAEEGVLRTDFDAEVVRATAAEAALQAEIDAEEVARAAADVVLQGNIDVEAAARVAGDADLASDIAAEEAARIAGDAAVQAAVDAVEVGAGLNSSGSYVVHATSNYIKAADFTSASLSESLHNADKLLDVAVKAEVDARIADVNAEETRALAAEGVLQGNIDAEAGLRVAGDANLQAQIDALDASFGGDISALAARVTTAEGDIDALEVRMTTAEGDIDTLQVDLAAEIARATAAEAAALASANTYTDGKVADLVNSAPAVLDTLKELADALGSDPNFATTVATNINTVSTNLASEVSARAAADLVLQGNIDAEAAARAAADSALSTRVSTLELFKDAQTVYVAKNGNDSTGNGGEHAPFLTLQAAMASITDASPTKRYIIKVKAGAYTETGVVNLKANVFVVGEHKDAVRIGATSFGLDSSFSGSADNRSGFANAILLNACTFDWQAVTSAAGKLYFSDVAFNGAVSMNGHNNAIAQAMFHSCMFYSTFTISGINVSAHRNNIHFGNITLNQHANGGMATILTVDGGTCSGTVTLNATTNDFGRRCSLFARSFYMEYLTVNGPSAYCDLTDNSVPRDISRVTKSNGGNIVYINTLTPIDTNSRNQGDLGKQYMYNFNYVNASTGTDLYVISMGTAYSADSSGKSIFIEADSYGLNANVNGGDVNISTAAVSGTGVRGKVKIDAKELDLDSKKIVNLANGVSAADAVNKSQLDASVAALQAEIDAEEVARAAADVTLQSNINAEAAARAAADLVLQGNIDAEAAARAAADLVLQGNIDAEAAARIAGDNALDARLDVAEADIVALESRMDTAEADIAALESGVLYVSKVVTRETPSGNVDGSNVSFSLAFSPVFGSEHVYLNGLLQEPGVGNDYTISGGVITMNSAPVVNDRIRVSYLKA